MEKHIYDINSYAAEEIARQLRLRDMGGIVIVDFIDMHNSENKNKLYHYMQDLMQADRAKHNVLPLTKFGLMQITRQRVRPATEINTAEKCPACNGTGKISSSILIDEVIERELAFYVKEKNIKEFVLKVNPILEAYLTKGLFDNIKKRWMKKYSCKIKIEGSTELAFLDKAWYDGAGTLLDNA